MPVLPSAKHEKFARGIAHGLGASEAYEAAGYNPSRSAASRLSTNVNICKRVAELLEWGEKVERVATERAIEKLAISKERVLAELAKIGFSDIRKAIKWNGVVQTETDNPAGGDVLVIRNIVSNSVTLIDSADLDDDTAAAISQISQNATGGITLKMHDKKGALVDIGRHLGMFIDRLEHTGKDGAPLAPPTVIRIVGAGPTGH
jgi:phage terminase small subunit